MKVVCFVLVNILVQVTDGVKPKSVNLALETVLRFDKKNYDADVNVINKVQNFLDTVKKHVVKNGRRNTATNNLKLTDFIKESAKILRNCRDSDLEDLFAVLDEEIRKYHYKGCKFYELVENINVRRFMSNQLEQAKGSSAAQLRKSLEKIVVTLENDTFNGKEKSLIQLFNSLYTGTSHVFRAVLNGLQKYKAKGADGVDLPGFLSKSLRTLLFDHYSNLNDNARSQLKNVVNSYMTPKNDKVYYNRMRDKGRDQSKLRVIDVDGFRNREMQSWSKFLGQIAKPSPAPRPVLANGMGYNGLPVNVGFREARFTITTSRPTRRPNFADVMGFNAFPVNMATTSRPTLRPVLRDVMGFNRFPINMGFKEARFTTTTSKPTYHPVVRDIFGGNILASMDKIIEQTRFKVTGATEKTATEEPITDEPIPEEPMTYEPIPEEPMTEEPITDETTTEEPITEESLTEKLTTTRPTTTMPTTTTPTTTTHTYLSTKIINEDEEDIASKSKETKNTKGKGKKNKMLRIKSPHKADNDDDELFLNPVEFTRLSPDMDLSNVRSVKKQKHKKSKSKAHKNKKIHVKSLKIEFVKDNDNNKDGISSETNTGVDRLEIIERELSESEPSRHKVKPKKEHLNLDTESQVTNYYGHVVNSNVGFLTDEEVDPKQDPLSIEHLSIETKAKETEEADPDLTGLLVGGQKVETMDYRSHLVTKKLEHEKKEKVQKKKKSHFRNREENDDELKSHEVHVRHKENQNGELKKISRHGRHKEKKHKEQIKIVEKEENNHNETLEIVTVGHKAKKNRGILEIETVGHEVKKHRETLEIETVGHEAKKHEKQKEIEPSFRHRSKKHKETVEIVDHKAKKHAKPKDIEPEVEEILTENSAVIQVQIPLVRTKSVRSETSSIKKEKDKPKHLRKNKRTNHKLKPHKFRNFKGEAGARKSLNDATNTQEALEDLLDKKVDSNLQTNETDLKMKDLLNMLESQLEGVQKQMERLDRDDNLKLLNNTQQAKLSLASSVALMSPTKSQGESEVTARDIVEKIMTMRQFKTTHSTMTTKAKPVPVFRSENINPVVATNNIGNNNKGTTIPPIVQSDIGQDILQNINAIPKEDNTGFSDTFDNNILKIREMLAQDQAFKQKLSSSNSTVFRAGSPESVHGTPSQNSQDQAAPKKDLARIQEQIRAMVLSNLNNMSNFPTVPDTTIVVLNVTEEPVTVNDDIAMLKKQWESLKSNMMVENPQPLMVTEETTLGTPDDGLKDLEDLQI